MEIIRMAKKRYSNVSKMLHDLSGDDQFNKEFDERVGQRQLVKFLIALRTVKNVSQADVANALGVTQSKISKIESGIDDDLRFGELKAYARALGMDIELFLANRERTIVDDVKFHAFRFKHFLDQLAKFAERDEGIAHGVANFMGEAFFNVVKLIQDSASRLPKRKEDGRPRVCIQIREVPMEEDAVDDELPAESGVFQAADEDRQDAALT